MNNSLQNQLVTQLSRDAVAQIAPDELLIFQATSDEYFKNPEKTLKGQAGGDDMIGFGAGEAELFLTPILLEGENRRFVQRGATSSEAIVL